MFLKQKKRQKDFVKNSTGKALVKNLALLGIAVGTFTFAIQMLQADERNLRVRTRTIQRDPGEPLIPSLKTVEVPEPKKLAEYVQDRKAAIQLGKALFWDTNVGSDNKMACASCHFNAGADNRAKNSVNPGTLNTRITKPDFKFPPNFTLTGSNFPFHRPGPTPEETVDTTDTASSAGVFDASFLGIDPVTGEEKCAPETDDLFHGLTAEGKQINTRRVEPRQAPSVINAAFYFRLFWDGRANNIFNGVDPFGKRNSRAFIWKMKDGKLVKDRIRLDRAHLASQAVGPALSGFEMSCKNRKFHDIAKKLLPRKILANQVIHHNDSVLGDFANMKPAYAELIKKAFKQEFWSAKSVPNEVAIPASMDLFDPPVFNKNLPDVPLSQMEANFSLFFGLAIQMYESTLVSDNAPIDQFAEGNLNALTEQQKRGMVVFEKEGKCINCHSGAEMTNASFDNAQKERLERMIMGNGKIATYDNGFYNIASRPTTEDLGVGGKDPFGRPLSETEMVKKGFVRLLGNDFDRLRNPTRPEIKRTAVKGAFKTPGLRNVELTGPYFHNGGESTLMQVVEMYNRGGNFRKENHNDIDPDITELELTEEQKKDLVAFMLSFTDERVRYKKAPFDHPSICLNNGHVGNSNVIVEDGTSGRAKDIIECLSAVGANGLPGGQTVKPFLNLDPFSL